jgi:hypothetical protein
LSIVPEYSIVLFIQIVSYSKISFPKLKVKTNKIVIIYIKINISFNRLKKLLKVTQMNLNWNWCYNTDRQLRDKNHVY